MIRKSRSAKGEGLLRGVRHDRHPDRERDTREGKENPAGVLLTPHSEHEGTEKVDNVAYSND